MAAHITITGVLLEDDSMLTVEELARACAVEPNWVVERVEAGLLGLFASAPHAPNTSWASDLPDPPNPPELRMQHRTVWRFASIHLLRARRLAALERDMDANPELAALVADLVEEVQRLSRCQQPAA